VRPKRGREDRSSLVYDSQTVGDYYDRYGDREWQRLASVRGRAEQRITLDLLERHLPPEGRVLDAGCGPGRYAVHLAQMGHRVTLVDISEGQLRLARNTIWEAQVGHCVDGYHRADICDLSCLRSEEFDAVVCLGGALSYVRERRHDALDELLRVAKAGAPLIVGVMSLVGTMHLIGLLDAKAILEQIEEDIEWERSSPLPDILDSRTGSREFHLPMSLYSSVGLGRLLEHHGCRVLEMAASRTISSGLGELPEIASSETALETLLALERQLATWPGAVDMGQHLLAAARTPCSARVRRRA